VRLQREAPKSPVMEIALVEMTVTCHAECATPMIRTITLREFPHPTAMRTTFIGGSNSQAGWA
jgi:hypothetical protein